MRPCTLIDDYLDRRLKAAAIRRFESHLGQCDRCSREVAFWTDVAEQMRHKEKQQYNARPSVSDVQQLNLRAERERNRDMEPSVNPTQFGLFNRRWRFAEGLILVLVLGLSTGLGTFLRRALVSSTNDVPNHNLQTRIAPPETSADGRFFRAPPHKSVLVELGAHRLGLPPLGTVSIERNSQNKVLIALTHGSVVCDISPMHRGEFIVASGGYSVRVIGTRFLVTRLGPFGLRVAVSEGTVTVTKKTETWQVSKGWELEVSAHVKAKMVALAGTDVSYWESLIIDATPYDGVRHMKMAWDTDRSREQEHAVQEKTHRTVNVNPLQETMITASLQDVSEKKTPFIETMVNNNDQSGEPFRHRDPTNNFSDSVSEPPHPIGSNYSRPAHRRFDIGTKREKSQDNAVPHNRQERPGVQAKRLDLREQSMFNWRQWIVNGMLEDAESALLEHLSVRPSDVEARYLLANCRRKAGHFRKAVDTYVDIAAYANPLQANRARFMAGTILQDTLQDNAQAARQFEGYLRAPASTQVLDNDARLRLARAYISLGRKADAKGQLVILVNNCNDAVIAKKAQTLLNAL